MKAEKNVVKSNMKLNNHPIIIFEIKNSNLLTGLTKNIWRVPEDNSDVIKRDEKIKIKMIPKKLRAVCVEKRTNKYPIPECLPPEKI